MSSYRFNTKNPWWDHTLLTSIILLGFALRLYKLGDQSLWYDETVSAFLANQPVVELIAHTARDIHPPGYYLLLHFWGLVAGRSEFALAFFSLIFGVLLIPLTHLLARHLTRRPVAVWSALLVSVSPYNIWYSQEVRMYTLGAALGLVAAFCALHALRDPAVGLVQTRRYWAGYLVAAMIGLYTLYYFAFLLIALNLFFLIDILRRRSVSNTQTFRVFKNPKGLLLTNTLLLVVYLPWLPIAWRQAVNPPVPPWRSPPSFWSIAVESWSALALGQSVEPATIWPILLITLALFALGLHYLTHPTQLNSPTFPAPALPRPLAPVSEASLPYPPAPLLLTYTFGPLLLIYLLSIITPLYHVRYLFAYAPPFYILLGAGLAWLAERTRFWIALVILIILGAASLFSIYQLHFDPRYRADDYRAAVDFIRQRWQPGDVILANAGYTYTAFVYYVDFSDLERRRLVPYQPPDQPQRPLLLQTGTLGGSPQLGWGNPHSDFYAMSTPQTIAALEQIAQDFPRLWMLRAYDTVVDPDAVIRTWLAEHTIPLEDQPFSGQSNIRVQGFLLAGQSPPAGQTIPFEDGLVLAGWSLPNQSWRAGQTIHLKLWWTTTATPGIDYKMSLKMWTAEETLAVQGHDEWPVGTLYRTTVWPVGQMVYHPAQVTLPPDLPAGQYWLNVELYHPETIQPLLRRDTGETAATLGTVVIE